MEFQVKSSCIAKYLQSALRSSAHYQSALIGVQSTEYSIIFKKSSFLSHFISETVMAGLISSLFFSPQK